MNIRLVKKFKYGKLLVKNFANELKEILTSTNLKEKKASLEMFTAKMQEFASII